MHTDQEVLTALLTRLDQDPLAAVLDRVLPLPEAWAALHEGVTVVDHGAFLNVNIPIRCSVLTEEGRCGVYGTPDRPQVCGDWPTSPRDLLETPWCGYRFDPIKE